MRHLAATLALAAALPSARAGALVVAASDAAGRPVADAVALLEPVAGKAVVKPLADVEISQAKRSFQPRVTLITVGTKVNFPNFDTVRHHVYSFSTAKTFELKLYAGVPNAPISFDKPGIAVLGCNIHDKMAAWVVVAETPWIARSGHDGQARIEAVPPGQYKLTVWHPALPANVMPAAVPVTVGAGELVHDARLAIHTDP